MKKILVVVVLSLLLALPASAQSPVQFVNPQMQECAGVGEGAPVPGWNGTATCTFDPSYQRWNARILIDGQMCQEVNATGDFTVEVCSYDAGPYEQSQRLIAYDGIRQINVPTGTGYNWRGCSSRMKHKLGNLQNPTICIRSRWDYPEVETIVGAMVLSVDEYPVTAEEETSIEFPPLGLCRGAVVSCWSSPPLELYINGLWAGPCAGDAEFCPRGIHSDTMTLVNPSGIAASYTITRQCDIAIQMGNPFPTPTPYSIHPVTQTMALPGGFLGIDFRHQEGRLPWLDRATELVQLVNSGNLLYIVGAVLMAGMVLSWAISQVKNPKSW